MDPPSITRHPENKLVATGMDAVFTVEATGDDLQFQWQKDGECIDRHDPRFHCSQTDTTSTLCIKHVLKNDEGHYKCVVKNPVAERGEVSHEAELFVCELSFDVRRMLSVIESFNIQVVTTKIWKEKLVSIEVAHKDSGNDKHFYCMVCQLNSCVCFACIVTAFTDLIQ